MSSAKRSLIFSFVTQYAELAIQFVAVLVLARLLSPKEIGTYSVAAFLMTILHVFRDFGVARYVVQETELTAEKIRSAIGVAIVLALVVAAILFSMSGVIAQLYHAPAIKQILVVMSASFAATPYGSVLAAIFRRDMQFDRLLIVRIASAICHVVTAISMALLGFGAVSLAWANFAGIVSYGVVAVMMASRKTPLIPHFKNFKEILSYGSMSSLGTVANVAGTNSPDVIIGKLLGLSAAGYFSRGNGLIQLFRSMVTGSVLPMVLPYFAQIRREKGDLAEAYYRAVDYLAVFSWPFLTVMGLLALPVVRTLYGQQWDQSVPVVQMLCVAGIVSTFSVMASEVMVANGHVRAVTITQLINSVLRVVCIVLAVTTHSLAAIGASLIVAETVSLIVTSIYLRQSTGMRFRKVIRATRISAFVTLASSAIPAFAAGVLMNHYLNLWETLIVGVIGATAGWIYSIAKTNHPLKPHLHQTFDWLLRNLMRNGETQIGGQPFQLRVAFSENGAGYGGAIISLAAFLEKKPSGLRPYIYTSIGTDQYRELSRLGQWRQVPQKTYITRKWLGRLGRPLSSAADNLFNLLPRVLRLYFAFKRDRIHLVYLNNDPVCNMASALAARLAGLPTILHARGFSTPTKGVRWVLAQLEHCIAVSNAVRQQLLELGLPSEKCTVVPEGLDLDLFHVRPPAPNLRRELGIAPQTKVITLVAGLIDWKGQDVLLDACPAIFARMPDTVVLLVGAAYGRDNAFAQIIANLAAAPEMKGRVRLLGNRTDIPDILSITDVVIHASTKPEPFGRTFLEGMAMGKAVIASAEGGPLEVIEHEVDGLLIKPRKPDVLAQAVLRLLEDENLARKLGENGAKKALKYSIENHANAICKVLHDSGQMPFIVNLSPVK
jgi:O-antigen/teichoic acid export membrane protein